MLKIKREGNVYYIVGSLLGTRVRQSTKLPVNNPASKQMAERIRLDVETSIINGTSGNTAKNVTVGEVADAYRNWKRVEGRLTLDTDRKIEKLSGFFNVPLSAVTTHSIQAFVIDNMSNLKANTIKRYLNQLRAILKFAEQTYGWSCPKIPIPQVDDARDVHLDAEQVVDVLSYFRDHEPRLYPHFVFLFDTGVRLGELLRVERQHCVNNVVRVRRTDKMKQKTMTRDIPMTDDVKNVVVNWPSGGLNLWSGNTAASAELNKALKRACAYCNLHAIRVHDARHTFAYLTAKAGADLGDLQYLLGHSDISMTMRYRGYIQSRARDFVLSGRPQLNMS